MKLFHARRLAGMALEGLDVDVAELEDETLEGISEVELAVELLFESAVVFKLVLAPSESSTVAEASKSRKIVAEAIPPRASRPKST